jgi:hypothetical protein
MSETTAETIFDLLQNLKMGIAISFNKLLYAA